VMLISIQADASEKLSKGVLQASLAEVAEIVSGFGFPKHLQGKTEGELPFFKVGDISKVWNRGQRLLTHAEHYLSCKEAKLIKTKVFPIGTVVFAKIGEAIKLNRRAILGQPSIVDNNVMGLIPRQDLVDTLYLYYYMLTVKLGDISQATTVPSVRKSDVEGITFPLVPIEAQKCIVAEIEKQFSRLDEAVANLKRVKANLKRYKAAILKAAVEGKLTEDWRKQHPSVEPASKLLERILVQRRTKWSGKGKYKEPARPDTSNLPSLPKGWAWCAVDQISRKITDGEHISPICQPVGTPLLSAKDVRESGVLFDEVKYVSPEDAKRFRMRCDPDRDDILIVSRGATIGRSCIVKTGQIFCLMGSVILIKVCREIAAPYIMTALKSVSAVKRLVGASGSTAQQAIYIQDIRSLPIPLPSHDEQEQIVAEVERRLSVIEELEAAVETNLTRADRLRQSILSQSFSGRLLGQDTKHIQDIPPTFSIAAESQASYGKTTLPGGEQR
jgi:type I restriction enzyme S subunit